MAMLTTLSTEDLIPVDRPIRRIRVVVDAVLAWLDLVERWFKELTDRRLRRGTFNSVAALVDAIETWVEHWNDDPKPFVWHKTASEIVAKVRGA